jgi:anti-sigma factor RsiW
MTEPPRIPDVTFNAYVDGRLNARAERETKAILEKDPAGAARAVMWRRQAETLRAAFNPVADEPLPLSILLKLRAATPNSRWRNTRWIAILAFVAGLFCGCVLTYAALQTLSPLAIQFR